MGCQIKIIKGKEEFFTPNGRKSNLYDYIEKVTDSATDAKNLWLYSYSKNNIEVDENQEPILKNNTFSDGTSLFNKAYITTNKTADRLWKEVDGISYGEFTKKVKFEPETYKIHKDQFFTSGVENGEYIISKVNTNATRSHRSILEDENYTRVAQKTFEFLTTMGINVMNMESYLDNIGYRNQGISDVNSIADTVQRVIALKKKDGTQLSEEVGHMAVDLYSNQDRISTVLKKIPGTPLYEEYAHTYKRKYSQFENLTEEEVENKVRREILGKYVGSSIENYPTGLKGVLKMILNKLLSLFNPTVTTLANQLATDVINARQAEFQNIEGGGTYFNIANSLVNRILRSTDQFINKLNKRKKGKGDRINKIYSSIEEAQKENGDPAALAEFVKVLTKDTQLIIEEVKKLEEGELTHQRLKDMGLYFAYFEPYIGKIDIPELKEDLDKLHLLFKDLKAIRNSFLKKAVVSKLEPLAVDFDPEGELQWLSVDDSLISKWFVSGADSKSPLTRVVHHMLSKVNFKVNDRNLEFARSLLEKAEELKISDTTFLYEKKNNKFTGFFVDPNTLKENQKKFAEHIKNIMTDLYAKIGYEYSNQAPQITASTLDVLTRSNDSLSKTLLGISKDAFVAKNDDTEFGQRLSLRPDGSTEKLVPRYFTKRLEDPNLISNDGISSVIMFHKMAENYAEMQTQSPVFENILEMIGKASYMHPSKGEQKGKATNLYSKIETLIEMYAYGEVKKNIEVNGLSVTKILNKVKSYVTSNNLANSFFTAGAGFISANVFSKLEDFIGAHSSNKSKLAAKKLMTKMYGPAALEIGKPLKKQPLNIWLEMFGLMGDTGKIFNNLNVNRMTRTAVESGLFSAFELTSYHIKSNTLLSILDHYRIKGNEIIKPGYTGYEQAIPIHEHLLNGGKLTTSQKHYISAIAKSQVETFEGGLNNTDYAAAHQNAWASLLLTHRNWLVRGATKRFKSRSYNYDLDIEESGMYVEMFNFLKRTVFSKEHLGNLKFAIEAYKTLDNTQKRAVKRSILEQGTIITLVVLANVLNSAFEDDDEGLTPYLLYLYNRSMLEISSISLPLGGFETLELLKNPFVAVGQVQQLFDLTDIFDSNVIERGPWEGYTKRERAIYKTIPGIKGAVQSLDPEYSNRWLKQGPLKYSLWFTD
jgi:hypothetical protein